ncbi:heat shock protein DnaJ domain protein [Thermodesulfatator indicus DSM 15286]|uniref:Heat shock protein DnaJ domain protein n=2 Tax=Thermodesulfatator indicus TaxID=171695 RepID=F8AA93_THEID|nr:heat shock protein DnaJ domain protein [Thermodesulfatator indicus DSM 15286]
MAFDPYRILGISPGAKPEEIKRAFRRKARLLHPDRGGEEKAFRELKRSYEFLKKKHLSPSLEIVKKRPGQGNYVFSFLDVTAKELALGAEVVVAVPGPPVKCEACQGKGKDLSGRKITCEVCKGKGQIFLNDKNIAISCPHCEGKGVKWLDLCPHCRGKGAIAQDMEITLKLPLGARPGDILYLPAEKVEARVDLYFELQVHESCGFYFEGETLVLKVRVPFWEAALKEEISICTLEGPETIKIPENFSQTYCVTLPKRGAYLSDGSRDDLLVKFEVYFPENLPKIVCQKLKEIKEIMKEVKDEPTNS